MLIGKNVCDELFKVLYNEIRDYKKTMEQIKKNVTAVSHFCNCEIMPGFTAEASSDLTRICASLGSRMKFKTLCYPVFGRNKNTALTSF